MVNREIKQLIAGHGPRRHRRAREFSPAPEVPPLRPAALEPLWSKGKLMLPAVAAASDGESVLMAVALKLLREEFTLLAADAEQDGAIDQRSMACIRGVANRIPSYLPAQDEVFYLAHLKEFLEAYGKITGDKWPEAFAKRYTRVTHYFDRTVQQFPKWRDFVSNAEKNPLTSEEATGIPALAKMMVAALRENEARNFIDPAIPSALEVLQAPLQNETARPSQQPAGPGDASKLLLANDVLESIDNIAKRTAEAALDIRNSRGPEGGTGASKVLSAGDDGQTYIFMTQGLLEPMTRTPALALHSRFCWLKPIVCLAGH